MLRLLKVVHAGVQLGRCQAERLLLLLGRLLLLLSLQMRKVGGVAHEFCHLRCESARETLFGEFT